MVGSSCYVFFFFQAEDGIRDATVTGVQTCALPIFHLSQALGQMEEAIELCRDCPQLAVLRKNIGIIYARKGDAENAKRQLELALKLLPEGPEALSIREALRRISSRIPPL